MKALLGVTLLAAAVGLTATVSAQTNAPTAIDGDTFRYNGETFRLLGLDTPEMPGHCRAGRGCAPGDPYVAKQGLQTLLDRGRLSILRVKKDRYGRVVAAVRANRVEVSCSQIRNGFGIYKPEWDDYGIIRQRCRVVTVNNLARVKRLQGERG
jgi:endonuclease YncB( thermonuclease family)